MKGFSSNFFLQLSQIFRFIILSFLIQIIIQVAMIMHVIFYIMTVAVICARSRTRSIPFVIPIPVIFFVFISTVTENYIRWKTVNILLILHGYLIFESNVMFLRPFLNFSTFSISSLPSCCIQFILKITATSILML